MNAIRNREGGIRIARGWPAAVLAIGLCGTAAGAQGPVGEGAGAPAKEPAAAPPSPRAGQEKPSPQQKKGQLRDLATAGVQALLSGDPEKAWDIATQMLVLDPLNKEAGLILGQAEREIAYRKKLLADFKALNKGEDALREVTQAGTEPDALPTVERPPLPFTPDLSALERQGIEKKLDQEISLNLIDAPLPFVLQKIFVVSGVNIAAEPKDLQGITLTLYLNKVPLRNVLEYIARKNKLTYTIGRDVIWFTTSDSPIWETRVIRLKKGLTSINKQEQVSYDPAGGSTSLAAEGLKEGETDLEKAIEKLPELIPANKWPEGSAVFLDRKMNALIVKSSREGIAELSKIVAELDMTPVQVLVETRLIEILEDADKDFGVDGFFINPYTRPNSGPGEPVALETGGRIGTNLGVPSPSTATSGLVAQISGILTSAQYEATLHLLEKRGNTRALSAPSIIALNNYTAQINILRDLVYIVDYQVDRLTSVSTLGTGGGGSGSIFTDGDDDGDGLSNEDRPNSRDDDADGRTDEDGTFADGNNNNSVFSSEPVIRPQFNQGPGQGPNSVGVTLSITPSVGADKKEISLILNARVQSLLRTLSFDFFIVSANGAPIDTPPIERPIVETRSLQTKLVINDGATVAMGGLKTDSDTTEVTKVPILGDLPILGRLFRRDRIVKKRSNLLIFVTAHILTPGNEKYHDAAAASAGAGTGGGLGAAPAPSQGPVSAGSEAAPAGKKAGGGEVGVDLQPAGP